MFVPFRLLRSADEVKRYAEKRIEKRKRLMSTIKWNDSMKDVFDRCSKILGVTPELVEEFFCGYCYAITKVQNRESEKNPSEDMKPRMNIRLRGIGSLHFDYNRIRCESMVSRQEREMIRNYNRREYKRKKSLEKENMNKKEENNGRE